MDKRVPSPFLIIYKYKTERVSILEQHPKTMEFMQIAMKYLPEAKQKLESSGIELSMETIQPMMELFTKVMGEAYELGKKDGQ
jgi:competence protein ComZ